MFLHHSPFWLRTFFPGFTWRIPTQEKKIFLTFDDGPIPEITDFVLDTLKEYQAKATFFCIGDNVRKNPGIFEKIKLARHSIGNHTFNHLNGWKSEDKVYLENIEQCRMQLQTETRLFRPPYGRIKRSQSGIVLKKMQIIMWDVLSGDFSAEISPEVCLQKSIKYTRNGSIVLFHDSIKASQNMQYTLPRYLAHCREQGFTFEALPMQ